MLGFVRPAVRAMGLVAGVAAAAGAQAAEPKACEVNESRPGQLGRASLAVMTASTATTPDNVRRQLSNAMRQLQGVPANTDNPVGFAFVYAKALVLWATQPGVAMQTTRGAIGFGSNPQAPIDLGVSIDSAFKVVEAAMPECISETVKWRSQKPWVDMVNLAIERLNAGDADSAAMAASRAILLNPFAPYGYVVLGNVRQREGKATEAMDLYRKSVEYAKRDTSYDDIRRQSLVYLGTLAVDSAENIPDAAARKPYVDQARAAFQEILADKPSPESAANARQGLCRVAIATGDTASLRETYREPLANPSGFEYSELMNAGVCMARAEMNREATTLFEGALTKNGYHRDVLSNLSIVLVQQGMHDRAAPLTARLVTVDPNNADNVQLQMLAYAGIARRARDARLAGSASKAPATKAPATKAPATKAPAATKTPPPAAPTAARLPQAVLDSLEKIELAYTDSAVRANGRKDSLLVRVNLTDFSPVKDKASLQGSLQLNPAVGAKPGDYLVKVDFLDATGGVVVAQEATVAVTEDRGGRFRVEGPGAGIVAFRYTVVPPRT